MKRLFYTSEHCTNSIFRYMIGFQPSDGRLLVDDDTKTGKIFLDGRYSEKKITAGKYAIEKVKLTGSFIDILSEHLQKEELIFLEKSLPVHIYEKLQLIELQQGWSFSFEPERRQRKVRIIKSNEEIDAIQEAITLTHTIRNTLESFAQAGKLHGMSELMVRGMLIQIALGLGAEAEAFDTIVAFGENSAIPHHQSGDTILGDGVLLVDMGWKVNGYCSDFTRTIRLGENPDALFVQVRDIVKNVHAAAIQAILPGASCKDVAASARKMIEAAGYGKNYPHSLGHGVGLDVHEAPSLSTRSEEVLEMGMVCTVEPGIYLPGNFGVRREDIVCVK